MPGVNEDVTKSEMARAVNSIPAYVEASSLFIALVPFVQHQDTMEWCSYTTWLLRGWCRAELWLHMLSRDSEQDSVVMINSAKEVKFMFPYDWLQNSVIGGKFSVEGDRAVVVSLCEETLEKNSRARVFWTTSDTPILSCASTIYVGAKLFSFGSASFSGYFQI